MESALKLKRFSWVVEGKYSGPDPICDVPILSTAAGIAVPTIGAIVPNWLLIVPRKCALSYAALEKSDRRDLLHMASGLIGSSELPEGWVYFEHGSMADGSVIGCGVDQAHLHLLRTEVDFVSPALADESVLWSETAEEDPWEMLRGKEYYFLRTHKKAFVGIPQQKTSQFFRKHIARAAGMDGEWDYNRWPNYENIRRTYECFNGRAPKKRSA